MSNYILKMAFATLLVASTWSTPAFATNLQDGIKLYNARDFVSAAAAFDKAVKLNPADVVAQYYLGHTYFAMGKMAQSKYAYQVCMHYARDLATQNQCKAAIESIDKYRQPRSVAAVTEVKGTAAGEAAGAVAAKGKGDEDDVEAVDNSPKAKIERQKAEVMLAARGECSKVRKELHERIAHEIEISNQICVWPDGHKELSLPKEIGEAFEHEAEEKCARIMQQAESRCRGFH